ncbi:I78 family peptidase inhibitor [Methylopila henanensis]|uniref:I78 family peptidase inhibitor n=1 Tax=Methylopila henanensis TaxID=873516 RepID=A0ABW4K552_9HYPH
MALALAGCAAGGATPPASAGACDPQAAAALVGRAKVTVARAREMTGAELVRQIAPGQPVTQDYRLNRVTIETDPATGRVVRASCG